MFKYFLEIYYGINYYIIFNFALNVLFPWKVTVLMTGFSLTRKMTLKKLFVICDIFYTSYCTIINMNDFINQ